MIYHHKEFQDHTFKGASAVPILKICMAAIFVLMMAGS
jgi:hypothetical protein